MKYKKCSLALGSGGLKGASHVGVLKVFEEEGFPIEYIAGSSAGSLVGALYATGHSADEIYQLLKEYSDKPPVNFKVNPLYTFWIILMSLLNFLKLRRGPTGMGVIEGKMMDVYLKSLFGEQGFEGLKYPLIVVATDITNGRLQVFTDKKMAKKLEKIHDLDIYTDVTLAEAVRASTSIPGILSPVRYRNKILVDGGVINAVPADTLRFAGAENIVGVDINANYQKEERQFDDLLDILLQTVEVMEGEMTDLVLERYASLTIRPKLENVSLKDFSKLIDIYNLGYQATREKVKAIKFLLSKAS